MLKIASKPPEARYVSRATRIPNVIMSTFLRDFCGSEKMIVMSHPNFQHVMYSRDWIPHKKLSFKKGQGASPAVRVQRWWQRLVLSSSLPAEIILPLAQVCWSHRARGPC
ncbi:uncharacterized protein LOC132687857 [Panthera onca]